jgi:hypothetical protein
MSTLGCSGIRVEGAIGSQSNGCMGRAQDDVHVVGAQFSRQKSCQTYEDVGNNNVCGCCFPRSRGVTKKTATSPNLGILYLGENQVPFVLNRDVETLDIVTSYESWFWRHGLLVGAPNLWGVAGRGRWLLWLSGQTRVTSLDDSYLSCFRCRIGRITVPFDISFPLSGVSWFGRHVLPKCCCGKVWFIRF